MRLTVHSKPMLKRSLYSLMFPDERVLLLFTPADQLLLPKLSPLQKALLLLCDGHVTVADMITMVQAQGLNSSAEEVLQILNAYDDQLLFEDTNDISSEGLLSDDLQAKYDRQLLYFAAQAQQGRQHALHVQRTLQDSHVVIVGVGCFGSHLLYGLSAAGIGKMTLVDFDTVEVSNLNRQCMYTEQDVGKTKISALKERCKTLSSSTTYTFVEQQITSIGDFVDLLCHVEPDLVVLTADSPRDKIFSWMNAAAYQTEVPTLFTIGVTQSSIRIGPLVIPGKTACFDCSMPAVTFNYQDPLIQLINTRHTQGVIAPHAMAAAGMMTLEILKHLTGFAPCQLYDTRIFLSLFTYETHRQKIVRRTHCPLCGDKGRKNDGDL